MLKICFSSNWKILLTKEYIYFEQIDRWQKILLKFDLLLTKTLKLNSV